MYKKPLFLFTLLLIAAALHAQAPKDAYERYLDFNLTRLEGNTEKALDMGEALLDSANALPEKSRVSFYNSMGKLYEDNHLPQSAIKYYEKVTVAVPNYYVAHRALGYIYLAIATDLYETLSGRKKNDPVYIRTMADYKAAALKALPHLEIAQGCDPSDETLAVIKTLYTNMGDTAGLATLNERLAKLNKNCLDILSDN